MEELLSIKEVARLLKVKVSTIYNWVHIGYIPYLKIGKLLRFDKEEIQQWLKERHNSGRNQIGPEVEISN